MTSCHENFHTRRNRLEIPGNWPVTQTEFHWVLLKQVSLGTMDVGHSNLHIKITPHILQLTTRGGWVLRGGLPAPQRPWFNHSRWHSNKLILDMAFPTTPKHEVNIYTGRTLHRQKIANRVFQFIVNVAGDVSSKNVSQTVTRFYFIGREIFGHEKSFSSLILGYYIRFFITRCMSNLNFYCCVGRHKKKIEEAKF